ncbi:hypothetical protein HC028_24090 [Planosporangium flavigriseum]|uniref:Peptidase M23 n=1 Tax=Planosporangium flavigriseum TaxID=373681 RepID=A0A8J3LYZ6_9ACTN|nr:hypothetical protein [Planosporangium flavigriseum]NJC67559.1 hypothetical protein [Planosporangium flavigriseum]GIG75970.1 hypothetical protein Pfl04_43740 [Planosporangium flavigriseum]
MRRYRRGRHTTESLIGPFLNGAVENIALARKSKLDPLLTDIATNIADEVTASIEFARAPKFKPVLPGKPRVNPFLTQVAASIAIAGIGFTTWSIASPASAAPEDRPPTAAASNPQLATAADRSRTDNAASRSHTRTAPEQNSAPAEQHQQQAPAKPAKPAPVAGLNNSQMDNAIAIVEAGKEMNLPRRAYVVAISTALQESNLQVLANPGVAGSMDHPNQGVGYDHDSIGLFQQRPNWGGVDDLMDPKESARRFYAVLAKLPGWEQLDVTVAAQRVQVSAFPDAYAKHQQRAEQIVDAILA